MTAHPQIRFPAVAGTFYSNSQDRLAQMVDRFLDTARQNQLLGYTPRVLIVPHAGYVYSGQVAATGFTHLHDFSRVILLGVSHREIFTGGALYQGDAWQTPLGNVPVDTAIVEHLVACPGFHIDNTVHEAEHSLEVQLPFLQQVLHKFSIVPILLSRAPAEMLKIMAEQLVEVMDARTVLVISSDLSHYPNQDNAQKTDHTTLRAILTRGIDHLDATITAQMRLGIPGLSTCACGATAIKVGMLVAHMIDLDDARILCYANSGDTGGDLTRVVGYAAVGFG